jgi:hypothetical protein
MEWIDINKTTPDQRLESRQNVLCFGDTWKNTYIAQYVNGRFKFDKGSQASNEKITHWMELPEPPKEQ